jgi:hypothetical protein
MVAVRDMVCMGCRICLLELRQVLLIGSVVGTARYRRIEITILDIGAGSTALSEVRQQPWAGHLLATPAMEL